MLENLRVEMQKRHICAYLIFNTDDHNSEYIPQDFMFVKALTGFTGDNAVVIVTENFAGLWTDSRFFLSGAQELENSGFVLKKRFRIYRFFERKLKTRLNYRIFRKFDNGSQIFGVETQTQRY